MVIKRFSVAFAVLGFLLPFPAAADWPTDPLVNVPICTESHFQSLPKIVSDGVGGAIITWNDERIGQGDIYAQRVLADGSVDPAWPTNGRGLCTDPSYQLNPAIATDGAGGAIVTWADCRNGSCGQIYAQRVLASGAVDPAWPTNGRALNTTVPSASPQLIGDGAGGAIVAWEDNRLGTIFESNLDIYVQRVLASGAVDPAWPANGRALCNATKDQNGAQIVEDGAGGAIVSWQDNRSGNSDVYVQHVRGSGTVDASWPTDGRGLCTASNEQITPRIASDGTGGAIVTWSDYRSGTNWDIYVHHVLADGTPDPAWPADGRAVCSAANDQAGFDAFATPPMIVGDGVGGAIITWMDKRAGSHWDIFAQHVLADGTIDPAWPANGRGLCTASGDQRNPQIVGDGAGGTIVAWQDIRSESVGDPFSDQFVGDIYAQHVLADGSVDPAWPVNGRTLCNRTDSQIHPTILADGTGGAIVGWADLRAGGFNWDIYAQRVQGNGELGGVVVDVWEGARVAFDLEAVYPNPTQGSVLTVSFRLSNPGVASLELFDVAGRRISARDVGSLGTGRHTANLADGQHLAPGIYLVRLRQEAKARIVRVAVLE